MKPILGSRAFLHTSAQNKADDVKTDILRLSRWPIDRMAEWLAGWVYGLQPDLQIHMERGKETRNCKTKPSKGRCSPVV